MMRIRQIVFAVRDLARDPSGLASLLGLDPPFRDPGVAESGIDNAVYVLGHQFVELIAPVREGTAAGRAIDRCGDCGYMLMLQTHDFDRERARIATLGVRTVWQAVALTRSGVACVEPRRSRRRWTSVNGSLSADVRFLRRLRESNRF